jgi:prepilin-type N-terminal cleavage/methylation domain-containing protein
MNRQIPANSPARIRGMTLLELLVVVAILAVLATVAIQSTSDIGNQTRYEVTQKALASFRDVVLGPANQVAPDGSPLVTGFIADMGRPPGSTQLFHPEYGGVPDLGELYSEALPAGLRPYALYPATSANAANTFITAGTSTNSSLLVDADLRVPAGWRGPYLRKPGTEVTLVDGWSKALVSRLDMEDPVSWPTMLLAFRTNTAIFGLPEDPNYTAVTDIGREVVGIFSQSGFEGAPTGSDAYSGRFFSGIQTNEYRVPLTVTVNCASTILPLGSTNYVLVMIYGPNPTVATDNRPIRVWAQQAPYLSFNTTFSFDGVNSPTVGTRVIRAIVRLGETTFSYSRVVYFPVRRGIQNVNIPLP